ncbi:Alpha/Beta hydrolase protein [Durotheca rogersii]|uniref:Alpha/Beta hydrolase protein n=1 Tax=Durotheca rogersii TaxID=419775 RepID=UPI002220B10A|nr:Alpha/Beta hydrolase protein [Durotheca rogersii]KAI5866466.1 Alpha/Beta hydrolase protein [Durotheca rogersii]
MPNLSRRQPLGVEEEDYVNAAEKSPRWLLSTHALAIRAVVGFAFRAMNSLDSTIPAMTETIWVDSTLGQWPGKQKISVDVWIPPRAPGSPEPAGKRPAVVDFHGGGFIMGQATEDARWAGVLNRDVNAVVFSVNYRLAPSYPFPTPVEDCVDATVQIIGLADKYDIDPDRIVISGFSAGGTLAFSTWVVLQDPGRWGYQLPKHLPRIAGLVLYYPVLDWTIDRPKKRLTCARPDLTLPRNLTDLIDASYLYPALPRAQRDDLRLSPGLIPDDMLDRLPPVHMCLCEYDMLLSEGLAFAKRAQARGKTVSVRVVEGERHAWDKPPRMTAKKSVAVEYGEALNAIKEWFDKTSR